MMNVKELCNLYEEGNTVVFHTDKNQVYSLNKAINIKEKGKFKDTLSLISSIIFGKNEISSIGNDDIKIINNLYKLLIDKKVNENPEYDSTIDPSSFWNENERFSLYEDMKNNSEKYKDIQKEFEEEKPDKIIDRDKGVIIDNINDDINDDIKEVINNSKSYESTYGSENENNVNQSDVNQSDEYFENVQKQNIPTELKEKINKITLSQKTSKTIEEKTNNKINHLIKTYLSSLNKYYLDLIKPRNIGHDMKNDTYKIDIVDKKIGCFSIVIFNEKDNSENPKLFLNNTKKNNNKLSINDILYYEYKNKDIKENNKYIFWESKSKVDNQDEIEYKIFSFAVNNLLNRNCVINAFKFYSSLPDNFKNKLNTTDIELNSKSIIFNWNIYLFYTFKVEVTMENICISINEKSIYNYSNEINIFKMVREELSRLYNEKTEEDEEKDYLYNHEDLNHKDELIIEYLKYFSLIKKEDMILRYNGIYLLKSLPLECIRKLEKENVNNSRFVWNRPAFFNNTNEEIYNNFPYSVSIILKENSFNIILSYSQNGFNFISYNDYPYSNYDIAAKYVDRVLSVTNLIKE